MQAAAGQAVGAALGALDTCQQVGARALELLAAGVQLQGGEPAQGASTPYFCI